MKVLIILILLLLNAANSVLLPEPEATGKPSVELETSEEQKIETKELLSTKEITDGFSATKLPAAPQSSQSTSESPQLTDESTHSKDDLPQSKDESIQSPAESSKSTDKSTQLTVESSQQTDTSRQSTEKSKQSTDKLLQLTDKARQSTHESPQSTDKSTHSSDKSTHESPRTSHKPTPTNWNRMKQLEDLSQQLVEMGLDGALGELEAYFAWKKAQENNAPEEPEAANIFQFSPPALNDDAYGILQTVCEQGEGVLKTIDLLIGQVPEIIGALGG